MIRNLPDLLEEIADEWSGRFGEASIHFSRELATSGFWIGAGYPAIKRLLNILL